jgi:hypothetical protein
MKKGKAPEVEAQLQRSLQRMREECPWLQWAISNDLTIPHATKSRVSRELICHGTEQEAAAQYTDTNYGENNPRPYTRAQELARETLEEGALIGYMVNHSGDTPLMMTRIAQGGQVITGGRGAHGMRYFGRGLSLDIPFGMPFSNYLGHNLNRKLHAARILVSATPPDEMDELATRPGALQALVDRQGIDHGEILADGSPAELTCTPTRKGSVPSLHQRDTQDEPATNIRNAQCQALVRRWQALTDPADRERIAAFWLGHPHPVLAAAGLALLGLQAAPDPTGETQA